MEFQEFVRIIQAEFPESEQVQILETTILREVISLNSMNLAILFTTVELEFDVLLNTIDVKSCITFNDLYSLIKGQ